MGMKNMSKEQTISKGEKRLFWRKVDKKTLREIGEKGD